MAKKQQIEAVVEETPKAMRPKDLADELNISPKSLRSYLRSNFTRPAEEKNTSWTLTEAMCEAAREHFSKVDGDEDEDDSSDDTDEES